MGQQWTARTLPPHLADTTLWRTVDVDALDEDGKSRFLKYRAAIEAYLKTGKSKGVAEELGLPRNGIVRQLNRCVALAEDGKPYGWIALIPKFRTADYERRAELPSGAKVKGGNCAGAFQAFMLAHPEIKQKIDNLIFKRAEKGVVHEARISVKNIGKAFVSLCEAAGLSGNDYPPNSRSRARRSLERYVRRMLECGPVEACRARFGTVAKSHLSVGTGPQSFQLAFAPYDVAGIDPHEIDCIGTVRILGPKGPQRVAIERLWIVPVLDDYSRAILGYSVAIRTECSAATIEQAIISAMSPWQPRELKIPKMAYATGAGLPSGRIPELTGRAWSAMMIDNAAIHYSRAIAERARRRLGCSVNYGPIGHWEHRAALERVMKTLETYGFQRLPSTMGASPSDPARNDPVRQAVELGIDWELLLDLIDVVIANYNVTPNEALGNRSPLSLLRDFVGTNTLDFLPRRLPPPVATVADLGVAIETKTVRGNLEEGRRPYIEIDRVHYTSPILSNAFGLIGKKMRVHIRGENMCTVRAYHESGEELGVLTAQGAWGRRVHTREMRKQINALRNSGDLAIGYQDDPIVALLQYLASETHRDAERKPMKVSRNATKLVRAAAASGLPVIAPQVPASGTAHATSTPPVLSVVGASGTQSSPQNLSVLIKPPQWKTIIR